MTDIKVRIANPRGAQHFDMPEGYSYSANADILLLEEGETVSSECDINTTLVISNGAVVPLLDLIQELGVSVGLPFCEKYRVAVSFGTRYTARHALPDFPADTKVLVDYCEIPPEYIVNYDCYVVIDGVLIKLSAADEGGPFKEISYLHDIAVGFNEEVNLKELIKETDLNSIVGEINYFDNVEFLKPHIRSLSNHVNVFIPDDLSVYMDIKELGLSRRFTFYAVRGEEITEIQ